jgi:hypothetical protein
MNNLIRDTSMTKTGMELKHKLFDWLEKTKGNQIPLKKPIDFRYDNRYNRTY